MSFWKNLKRERAIEDFLKILTIFLGSKSCFQSVKYHTFFVFVIQNFDFLKCFHNEIYRFRTFFFMQKLKFRSIFFTFFRNLMWFLFSFFNFLKRCLCDYQNIRLKSVILHLHSSSYLTSTLHDSVLKNCWGRNVPNSNMLFSHIYIYIYMADLNPRESGIFCLGLTLKHCHSATKWDMKTKVGAKWRSWLEKSSWSFCFLKKKTFFQKKIKNWKVWFQNFKKVKKYNSIF